MVKKVITNLDSSKASCPDFIPVVVLKSFCKYQLNSSICVCLSHCSLAVPGERSIAKNYHLLVFFLWFLKLFETLVNNSLVDHQEKCGLFSDFWYDFRSSQSTADLLGVVSGGATRAVALDISKVFVKAWDPGLLHKLKVLWNFRPDIWPYFLFSQ